MKSNNFTKTNIITVSDIIKQELQRKKSLGFSIILYDRKTKVVYKENSDGTKEIIGNKLLRGRYSERVNR